VEKPVILMQWTPPLDEPEPRVYPPMNNSVYRMKRNASPIKRKVILTVIAPGGINTIITKGRTPRKMPKPKKGKPRKNPKEDPQTTRPSKTVSFETSSCLKTKLSK